MINRELIRLKVVQLVYAYYRSGEKEMNTALKELDFSLSKAYDLYLFLLNMLVSLQHYGQRKAEASLARAERLGLDKATALPDQRFAENKVLSLLSECEPLMAYREKRTEWDEEPVFIKDLYNLFTQSDIYNRYFVLEDYSFEADRELLRKLYKSIVQQNDDLEEMLEEKSLYWNDDKEIVDSFVLKTIRRLQPDSTSADVLLPEYESQEDQQFGHQLFSAVIERQQEVEELIKANIKNWEFSRLAFMDIIIAEIALTEILTFSDIPLNVSFNEYLDIAKVYSTPRSAGYINGLLDAIVKKLKAEGQLLK